MADVTVIANWKGKDLKVVLPENASVELRAAAFDAACLFHAYEENPTEENFGSYSEAHDKADTLRRLHYINQRREAGESALGVADLAVIRKAGKYSKEQSCEEN